MIPQIEELLQSVKQQQDEQKRIAGRFWRPDKDLEDLVFTTTAGRPFSLSKANVEIKKVLQQIREKGIDIPDITPHTCRKLFASRGFEKGIPPKVMQQFLGHSSI
jgi:site-specific recombinase XerD